MRRVWAATAPFVSGATRRHRFRSPFQNIIPTSAGVCEALCAGDGAKPYFLFFCAGLCRLTGIEAA